MPNDQPLTVDDLALRAERRLLDSRTIERLAVLESKIDRVDSEIFGEAGLRSFRTDVVIQLTELKADIKNLSWRVAIITGAVIVAANQLLNWAFTHLLK